MDVIWGNTTQYTMVYWPWPIAIYLFLAGLSAGALMVSILVKWLEGNETPPWDGLIKAGAMTAPLAIILGLGLLVVDLGKPLTFWYLMVYVNPMSIMSIGVWLLSIYTPLALIFGAMIFSHSGRLAEPLKPFAALLGFFERLGTKFESLLLLLSIGVAAYTGFLLSAVPSFPLFNQPVLPLLFLVSGFSAGIASNILLGLTVFKSSVNENNLKYLLALDLRVVPFEMVTLFIMFMGMHYLGGAHAVVAAQVLTTGTWASVFWLGVVGIGLVVPVLVAVVALHGHSYKLGTVLFNSAAVLAGVLLLRFYILYAGQLFPGV